MTRRNIICVVTVAILVCVLSFRYMSPRMHGKDLRDNLDQHENWKSTLGQYFNKINVDGISKALTYLSTDNSSKQPKDHQNFTCLFNRTRAPRRNAVLIYSATRSGSTFLGEFFNQHPSVYYLFEPLHGADFSSNHSSVVSETVLKDHFHCNYDRIPHFYKQYINDQHSNCRSNVCFHTRSKFLWRNTELCKRKHPHCLAKTFDTKVLSTVCSRSLFTAAKVVKLPSLSYITPLLQDESLNLKVIQLVRDPRAVIPSQMKMANASVTGTAMKSFADKLCQNYHDDSLFYEHCIAPDSQDDKQRMCNDSTRKLWSNNFIRLSHEYISENPKEAMKQIYDFVGLNIDNDVFEWLKRSTNHKSTKSEYFFGTKRDSRRVLTEWRQKQSFANTTLIQNHCAAGMEGFGYVPVGSEQHLRNISCKLYSFERILVGPNMIGDNR